MFLDAPISATSADITVVGMKPTGSLKTFWCPEDTTDLDKVTEVTQDFLAIPTFQASISLQELKDALGKTKLDKARGPDSWSPWELKNLPDPFLLALASLLNAFTETGRWPVPVTQATVSVLSKIDSAFQVEQTSPITLLSLIYRFWSRIYALNSLSIFRDFFRRLSGQ